MLALLMLAAILVLGIILILRLIPKMQYRVLSIITLVLTVAFDSYRQRKFPETKLFLLAGTVAVCVTAGSLFR